MTMSLGSMVVRLALEMAQYKTGWNEAATQTEEGAKRVEAASTGMDAQAGRLQQTLQRQTEAFGQATSATTTQAAALQATAGVSTAAAAGLAAVAVGAAAVGYAAYKGYREQQQLNDSLVLTGNYAGLAAGQLDRMAVGVATSIGAAVGDSREVLATLASTGRFTVDSLGEVATAVQLVARYSGQSNAEVAKNFAGMADGVAKWAAKANESYHFLDLTTYQYIKRLEEQGRTQDAVRVASEALSEHLGKTMTQNLGYLERAWLSMGNAASKAWSAMKNVGKDGGIDAEIATVSARLEAARGGLAARSAGGSSQVTADEALLKTLIRRKEILDSNARAQSDQAQATQTAIRNDEAWGRIVEGNLKPVERLNSELAKMRQTGRDRGSSEAEMAEQEARIRARYTDKGAARQESQELERRRRLLAELSGVQASYMDDLRRLNAEREAGNLTEERYIALVTELIAKQPMAKKLMDEQAKAMEAADKATIAAGKAHEQYLHGLDQGLEKLRDQVRAQNDANDRMGLGKVAIAQLEAARLEDQATMIEGLAIKKLDRDMDMAAYELYKAQAVELRNLAAAKRSGAVKEEGIDSAKAIAKEWERTGEWIERTLLESTQRGFEGGEGFAKNFFKSLEATAKNTVLRFGVQMASQGVTGWLDSALGRGSAAGTAGGMGNLGQLASLVGGGTGYAGLVGSGVSALLGTTAGNAALGTTLGLGASSSAAAASAAAVAGGSSAAAAGGMASLGASIGAAIPWVGLALAVASIFSKDKGGPKSESAYSTGGGIHLGNPAANDPSAAKTVTDSIVSSYQAFAQSVGIKAGQVDLGVLIGRDPKGTSQTALQVAGTVNGQMVYNRAERGLGGNNNIENVGRSEAELTAAVAEDTARFILAAAQASEELSAQMREIIGSTDAYTASLDQVNAVLARASKAGSERIALEERLFQATATDVQKLARARDQEREAMDSTNHALLETVWAAEAAKNATESNNEAQRQAADIARQREGLERELLQEQGNIGELRRRQLQDLNDSESESLKQQIWNLQDQRKAAEDAQRAHEQAMASAEQYANALRGAGGTIAAAIRDLTVTQGGTATGTQLRDNARAAYLQDLGKARTGDVEASQRVAQSFRAYLEANASVSTMANQAAVTAQVIAELQSLPATQSYENQTLAALTSISTYTQSTWTAVQSVGQTVQDSVGRLMAALPEYFDAIDKNTDDMLTLEEFKAAIGHIASDAQIAEMIRRLDTNGDGQISRLEAIKVTTGDLRKDTSNGVVPTLIAMQLWNHTDMTALAGWLSRISTQMDELKTEVDKVRVATLAQATHQALASDSLRQMNVNGVLVYTDPAQPLEVA